MNVFFFMNFLLYSMLLLKEVIELSRTIYHTSFKICIVLSTDSLPHSFPPVQLGGCGLRIMWLSRRSIRHVSDEAPLISLATTGLGTSWCASFGSNPASCDPVSVSMVTTPHLFIVWYGISCLIKVGIKFSTSKYNLLTGWRPLLSWSDKM